MTFDFRLRTRFLHDLIMPQDEYSPLKELVLFPRLDVVVTLADICHTDRVPLASSLLRIFRFSTLNLLSYHEIGKAIKGILCTGILSLV